MKNTAIALAAALAAVATPAFAAPQGKFGEAKVTYNSKSNKYCFSEVVTGSRIPVSECRTKAEWADAGLNIAHKANVQMAQK